MAKKKVGLHESRTRVSCYLPLGNNEEEKAVNDIIAYVQDLRKKQVGVKGFTRSALRPRVFVGYWWNKSKRKYEDENVVLLIIDYQVEFDNPDLTEKIGELKREISRWYKRYTGKPQDEIWVIAQPVTRYD